ncbi:MAG: hypothetical protein WD825_11740 [Gemmatimonadaceae bacterium]
MKAGRRSAAILAVVLLAGCVIPGVGISPYGRATTVHPKTGPRVAGELLAANGDTVWLLSAGAVRSFGAAELRSVDVARHRFGAKKTFVWMSVAGLGTGVALLISCSSYASTEDGSADCGGVLPGTFLFFVVTGAVFALFNEYSSKHHLKPDDTPSLRPFARFPQGLPDSLAALAAPRAP